MSVNKVILVGHVGKDAEVRYIDSGVAVATFSFATSESYVAKTGEKVTNTDWHNIVAWRGLGEFAGKYIQKGRQLYIEGRIKTRSYDDKDGNKRYITEILADTIQLLGKKEMNENAAPGEATSHTAAYSTVSQPQSEEFTSAEPTDDLPF